MNNGLNKYSNDMREKIREILVKYNDNKERNDKAEAELLDLFFVSSSDSTIKTANGILDGIMCECEDKNYSTPEKDVQKCFECKKKILPDVKEKFNENKMKRIVPHYIVGLGDKLNCNELRFIITDFLNRNESYKKEVDRLNSL